MSDTVIKIENLYKEYHLGVIGHGTLYRDLQSWWAKMQNKEDPNSIIGHEGVKKQSDRILALNNVSLEIKKGDILGIIGGNGAGKSTLLKILSRVTTPTSGIIKIKGKIASLLEVGTGFHTELTGRENIYLNGAINGMNRKDVTKKIHEIIEFAGVEKFIDTPVKRYSSGMFVRLGFAVAAHLDPDILVVDEVLAVGDADFQKKAIGKMKDVSNQQDRTVLFVSHNMSSITNLCNKAILLNQGQIVGYGSAREIVNQYMGINGKNTTGEKIWNVPSTTNWPKNVLPGKELVIMNAIRVIDKSKNISTQFSLSKNIYLEIEYDLIRDSNQMDISFYLKNDRNELVCIINDDLVYKKNRQRYSGSYKTICEIPKNFLNDGQYFVTVLIQEDNVVHIRERDIITFVVVDNMEKNGVRGFFRPGKQWPMATVRPKFSCYTKKVI